MFVVLNIAILLVCYTLFFGDEWLAVLEPYGIHIRLPKGDNPYGYPANGYPPNGYPAYPPYSEFAGFWGCFGAILAIQGSF